MGGEEQAQPLRRARLPGAPFLKRFHHYRSDAFLLAPIVSRDRVIGVLSITEKMGEDSFDAEEQELLLAIAGQVISAIDIERLSESLRKSRDEVRRKNMELKSLERVRTELFNMLIHDLKGPLSEIVANLDILSFTTADENLECVTSALSGCDTLLRMISDLLDITRMEQGCLEPVYQEMDPADLIHESVIRLVGMAGARRVELKETAQEGTAGRVFQGDRGILLRVLQNLIINAVQHSPPGEAVETGVSLQDDVMVFSVSDHGPGIAPEFHEAVFDKFFQIRKKSDGRRYSTGLGLTYCRMAVEAHRGSIRVESDGIGGSRFVFTIPVHAARHAGRRQGPRSRKKA